LLEGAQLGGLILFYFGCVALEFSVVRGEVPCSLCDGAEFRFRLCNSTRVSKGILEGGGKGLEVGEVDSATTYMGPDLVGSIATSIVHCKA